MKDKKLFITIVSIFTIISFIIGVSYAYFTVQVVGNDTASIQNVKTGTLKINYTGTDTLDMNNTQPPDTKSMTFSVTNSGTLPVNNYQVYFSKVLNEILNDEMVYTLTCQSSDTNTCQGKEETPLPKVVGSALTQPSIAPGTTHTYTLSVTFKDTGSNQDYNQNKRVSFKITINEQQELGTLVKRQAYYSTELFWEHRANITEVTFEDSINIPNGVTSWDVSANQDSSVMAYIIDDGLGTNTYKLYIQSNGILNANPNSSYLLYNFTKLKTINNLSNFSTSSVTDMSWMFYGCSSLSSLDLSNFDTSSVTHMSQMFFGCSSLTSVELSNFNTSSVTTMSSMFYECSSLSSLDLSNFNTSNVTSMSHMFLNCSSLSSLDLSNFNTSSVTTMISMFYGCSSLSSLELSNFNTSSVTDMSFMFLNCSSLTSVDLSNFDTSSVTTMYSMFDGCISLTSLELSNFDTSNVTNMSWMFRNCSSLTSLDLSNFNISNVTDMRSMFYGCSSLTSLDLHNATFTSVTTHTNMFRNITSGINIIVKDVDSQTFINARLSDASKTGNVTIYVP